VTHDQAFLDDIRATPDDDAPRLIYADYLEENGQPDRAEFIRVQCELATLPPDHERRPALVASEAAILRAHAREWTDLDYAAWLDHPREDCNCPRVHRICELTAEATRIRCALEEGVPKPRKRRALKKRLAELASAMGRFYFGGGLCHQPFFERYEFRRGFIESADIEVALFTLHPGAAMDLCVLRHLMVFPGGGGGEDDVVERLLRALDGTWLETLTIGGWDCPSALPDLIADPRLCRLRALKVGWLDEEGVINSALSALAEARHFSNLETLELGAANDYREDTVRRVLASPWLPRLKTLRMNAPEPPHWSDETVQLWRARFGHVPGPDCD
jgi:uncharacterized protein (TIGR02996 family)